MPGAVDGWFELHARFGRLPLRELLAPSIEYAREGFPVTEVIGAAWAAGARELQDSPGFAAVFMPNGRAPASGEPFANPALARAYELIADDGRAAFYGGPIAAAIEDSVRGNGGYLGREDLAAHRSEWVEPVATTYRGWQRLRAAAERPGHRGAADAEHPRRLRSRRARVGQRRAPAPA